MIRSAKKVENKLKALLSSSPRASVNNQLSTLEIGDDTDEGHVIKIKAITRQQNGRNNTIKLKHDVHDVAGEESVSASSTQDLNNIINNDSYDNKTTTQPSDSHTHPDTQHRTHEETTREINSAIGSEVPVGRFRVSSPTVAIESHDPFSSSLSASTHECSGSVEQPVTQMVEDVITQDNTGSFPGTRVCDSKRNSQTHTGTTRLNSGLKTAANEAGNDTVYARSMSPTSPVQSANSRFSIKNTILSDSPPQIHTANQPQGETVCGSKDHSAVGMPVKSDRMDDVQSVVSIRSGDANPVPRTTPLARENKTHDSALEAQRWQSTQVHGYAADDAELSEASTLQQENSEVLSTSQGRFSINNSAPLRNSSVDSLGTLSHGRSDSAASKTAVSGSRFSVIEAELQGTPIAANIDAKSKSALTSGCSPTLPAGASRYTVSGVVEDYGIQQPEKSTGKEPAIEKTGMVESNGHRSSIPVGRFSVTSPIEPILGDNVASGKEAHIMNDEENGGGRSSNPVGRFNVTRPSADSPPCMARPEPLISMGGETRGGVKHVEGKGLESTDQDTGEDNVNQSLAKADSDSSVGRFLVSSTSKNVTPDDNTSSKSLSPQPHRFSVSKSDLSLQSKVDEVDVGKQEYTAPSTTDRIDNEYSRGVNTTEGAKDINDGDCEASYASSGASFARIDRFSVRKVNNN